MAQDNFVYPRRNAAFVRAVQRERDAIALHRAAAARHIEAAIIPEHRAAEAEDTRARETALQAADECRARARAALDRAEEARRRLRSVGVDPE